MRDIGIDVEMPDGEWDGDANCTFYGSLRLRGQVFEGTVSRTGMQKTIVIERDGNKMALVFRTIDSKR